MKLQISPDSLILNLGVEGDNRRQAEIILKMESFHTTKCRAYPHEKLNTSKGVIRSREFALATEEEITSALGKQGTATCLSRWTARGRQKTLKRKTFHMTKCRTYPHEKLNTSKGVIRSRELVLATEEKSAALGELGVTNIKE